MKSGEKRETNIQLYFVLSFISEANLVDIFNFDH